jgi:SNF2 family DNA or RNA helicase
MFAAFKVTGGSIATPESMVRPSRWAAEAKMVAGIVDGRACSWVEGRAGSATVATGDQAALEAGHVCVADRWFALDPGTAAQVQSILDAQGASLGPLTLKQLLGLRSAKLDPTIFDDRIDNVVPEMFGAAVTASEAPRDIAATLYPYQLTGWKWLSFLARYDLGGLLADEMGLGKTLQVISLIADPGDTTIAPVLVIAPGTLLENWRRELERFAPKLSVLVHAGPSRTGSPRALRGVDVVVTSYDTVVRDNGLLATVEWDAVVLDEAQSIRNPETARAAAVFSLRRRRSFAITGTPVENRLLDLWSIMNFVAPGHLGTVREFRASYSDDLDGAARLEPMVSPLMLRRRVMEVAQDLPERIDIDVPLVLPPAEAQAYDALRLAALAEYGAVGPMVAMTKLRQFCGHPLAVGLPYGDSDAFPKMERLIEICEEVFASGEKVIIFSAYTAVSDLIVSTLRRRLGAWVDQMDGRVALDQRQAVVDGLTTLRQPGALVLNPKVAAAGLNITAATHVIHYGLEWNPALEAQASARAWRRGQDRPVTIHRLFFVGTVEEVMNDRLQRKRDISDLAVVGVEGSEKDRRDAIAAMSVSPLGGSAHG